MMQKKRRWHENFAKWKKRFDLLFLTFMNCETYFPSGAKDERENWLTISNIVERVANICILKKLSVFGLYIYENSKT